MKYSIIGTGNMAWFLAQRLTEAGHKCTGIYGRNAHNARQLAEELDTTTFPTLSGVSDGNDICFIAVTDHAIPDITSQLYFKHTTLVHTAGSVAMDVLAPHAAHYGVLWPIGSILKYSLPKDNNIPCVWEASSDTAKAQLLLAAQAISHTSYEANSTQRLWLHLTAVMSSNFTNHLMAVCEQICAEQQLPFTILLPILHQIIDRASDKSPHDLQTGPARRGDTSTIQKHLQLLQIHPQWAQVYKALTTSIETMYNDKA
ncbi:MAG: Rossmann-like and DUF2520 domain-containing protein [Bacteroidota bacterium]